MWDQGKSIAMAVAITKKRQIEVSSITGITPQRISMYKAGKQGMSIPIAQKFADAFGMKLSDFVRLGE